MVAQALLPVRVFQFRVSNFDFPVHASRYSPRRGIPAAPNRVEPVVAGGFCRARAEESNVAPGFAPVYGDCPRSLRGEPGTNPFHGGCLATAGESCPARAEESNVAPGFSPASFLECGGLPPLFLPQPVVSAPWKFHQSHVPQLLKLLPNLRLHVAVLGMAFREGAGVGVDITRRLQHWPNHRRVLAS